MQLIGLAVLLTAASHSRRSHRGAAIGKVHRLGFLSPVGDGTAAVIPQAVGTVSGVSIALPKT